MTNEEKLKIATQALKDCRAQRNVGENVRVIVDTALSDIEFVVNTLPGLPEDQVLIGSTLIVDDRFLAQSPPADQIRQQIAENERKFAERHLPKFTAPKPTLDRTKMRPAKQIAGWEWDCPTCDTTIVVGRENGTRKQLEDAGLDPRCPTCQKGGK